MTQIKAFIFDLDGVITDTAELHFRAWKRLADEEGIPFTREDNEHLRGLSRRASLERMLAGRQVDEETMQVWMTRKNEYYRDSLKTLTPADLLPGADAFLRAARAAGLRTGLGSASKNAQDVLSALHVIDLFDVVGDGHSVINAKPAPDLFVWVAGGLGVSPQEAVVFEDAAAGVEAALVGGFYAVGVGTAGVDAAHIVIDGLAQITPEDVIRRLSEASPRTTP